MSHVERPQPPRRRLLAGVSAAACLVLGSCSDPQTAEGPDGAPDEGLVVKAGTGGFAFEAPRRPQGWWATFAFPLCSSSAQTLTMRDADMDVEVAPTEVAYHLLTYEDDPEPGARVTRGGYLKGVPEQVERGGSSYIKWGGHTLGTVSGLDDVEVEACGPQGFHVSQYLAVSMRVGPDGAAANALRVAYTDGGTERTSAPTDWKMVACGRQVEETAGLAGLC